MHAEDLMSHPVISCHVNDTLNIAAQRMWDHDCGAIAVVNDDGKLVGMVTDRDICMAAHTQGRSLDEMLVNAAMSRGVVSARAKQSLHDVEQLMAHHQIRRIPVIDGERRPIGLVSLNDIARESVQPDTKLTQGAQKVTHTLAAICTPRIATGKAA
jgi:CBS domain-containing protein